MNSERRWRRFSVFVPVYIAIIVFAMAFSGRFLPKPFGDYNPMDLPSERVEAVWENAVRNDRPPCVLFVGDSRIAFHINSAQVSSDSCPARNYGFPGLGISDSLELAEQSNRRLRTVVIGIDDNMVMLNQPGRDTEGRSMLAAPPLLLPRLLQQNRLIRSAYLSFQRYAQYFSGKPLPRGSGWVWDENLGRWTADTLETHGPLDDAPYKSLNLELISKAYFEGAHIPADIDALLDTIVARLQLVADHVAIFIPPQHPDLAELAEKLAPGQQQRLREAVLRVSKFNHVTVIDCSFPDACGVDRRQFIDAVHLGPSGAKAITREVAERLSIQ